MHFFQNGAIGCHHKIILAAAKIEIAIFVRTVLR